MASDVGESYNRYSIAIPTQVDQNTREKEKDRRERRRKIEREACKENSSKYPSPEIPEIRPPKRKVARKGKRSNSSAFCFPFSHFSYPVATRYKKKEGEVADDIREHIPLRVLHRRLSSPALSGQCSRSADPSVPLPRP